MTPAGLMESIPAELLRRHTNPHEQIQAAKRLAHWLLVRGYRVTWAELEDERARRASASAA